MPNFTIDCGKKEKVPFSELHDYETFRLGRSSLFFKLSQFSIFDLSQLMTRQPNDILEVERVCPTYNVLIKNNLGRVHGIPNYSNPFQELNVGDFFLYVNTLYFKITKREAINVVSIYKSEFALDARVDGNIQVEIQL